MKRVSQVLVNELGNRIALVVTRDEQGVTVLGVGPTSQVEHTWTPLEAKALRELLEQVEDDR